MAILFISEYSSLVVDETGKIVPVAQEPAPVTQIVTYTTSTESAAFASTTKFVRLIADAKAHYLFGDSPQTAVVNVDARLPADVAEYFGVVAGQVVAVVA